MKIFLEMDIQNLDDGVWKFIFRDKVIENKRCLRFVRQNESFQFKVVEESGGQKSVKVFMQNQKGKGEVGNLDFMCLRLRKIKSQFVVSILESKFVQRVMWSVKRCVENLKKVEDNVCVKKIRIRSYRDSEDI